ncbi:outer membrane protein with beta-barrel domain [Gillisia sp. Hel_I_86]|uniref:outer membrane beta-barrel protein n=1 Tax=Gillisia sp. Hel_I_86 TaxID=1249981 RepID=UPI00119B5AA1|nr:outer membrane beta-barrel protein [Gillisia sp. Hel_I_86]TVZ26052.1 outer membrane protein with beta-barrel domain [Gillisia sp. Hel_I_86]
MKNTRQLNRGAKILFCLLSCMFFSTVHAQQYSVGLKAGLNYSMNNEGSEIAGGGDSFSAESKIGYVLGAFAEVEFGKFFMRPEILYNHTTAEFPFSPNPSEYVVNKVSIPLLIGYNIFGPIDIYAGPSYQFFTEQTLENIMAPLEQEYNNLAAQIGIKVVFRRFELDLRYDFTFTSDDNQLVDINGVMNNAYFDDGRLNQAMLSLSYKLFGSNIAPARRKDNCYF